MTKLRSISIAAFAAFAALAVSACGGALTRADFFSSEASADGADAIEKVRRRLARARPMPGTDIAVGVAGNGDKIVAVLLEDGRKWTYAHPLDARPAVAGQVVVGSGGGEIFCLDARTGNKLWVRPTGGLPLIGAGDDGRYTVVTLGHGSHARGFTLLAVERSGDVDRQIETDESVGVPAVASGLAFIPWGRQYVSVFDIVSGDEPARIVLGEHVSHAWMQGGSIYFGEASVYRFDTHIQDAADPAHDRASHVILPSRELPGAPALMPSIQDRPKLVATDRDRTRMYLRPKSNGPPNAPNEGALTVAGARYYATYFRIVMGFDASRDQPSRLAWVRTHPSDIIAGAAAEDGLVACDEQGKVTFLGARQGEPLAVRDLGEPVKSCVVHVDRLAASPASPERATPPASLADDLAEALRISDPELALGKRLLIREIATLDDPIATKALIDASVDPALAPFVIADVRSALASRRKGAQYMLSALETHYDFMKGTLTPPPVGPIAQSLAAMNDPHAAPLLTRHLLDPATPEQDVQDTALALTTLARPSDVPALEQFFTLNYASATTAPLQSAVISTAQILLKQAGKSGRTLVDRAIASKMTAPDLRDKLRELR